MIFLGADSNRGKVRDLLSRAVSVPSGYPGFIMIWPLSHVLVEFMEQNISFMRVIIEKPDGINVILGQSHFIKTVEDIYEAVISGVPGVKFGLAFCESSGDCLVRLEGNDKDLKELAKNNALAIGAGHSFILFLRDCYPINILNAIKNIQEVCTIYCATANPAEVIIAETGQGRGIMGVVDGLKPKGVEGPGDVQMRTALLRQFGYKKGNYQGMPLP